MTIFNEESLKERASNLQGCGLNGFRLVLVSLSPADNPERAHLEVHFHNSHELTNIVADAASPELIFPVYGGRRILAGSANGDVKVVSITQDAENDCILHLSVEPIGDYSTYTLGINFQNIDPVFNEIDFKFRPGCFSIECAPEWEPAQAPKENPVIDYLAKDYHSFKHTLINAMMQRVPGWHPTSEADMDQVLLELFCAAADELSDFQDRVMNEAYLGTARKRVSLARHARLMDYHIHQGNQAGTWLAVKMAVGPMDIPTGSVVWAGSEDGDDPSAVVFLNQTEQHMDYRLNQLGLYSWTDAIPSLTAGSTTADVQPLDENGLPLIDDEDSANDVAELIRSCRQLLIQEWLNPMTGRAAGRDPGKRQILRLLPEEGATAMQDPVVPGAWFVRVSWEKRDALKADYCFTIDCEDGIRENVSLFHGNLVPVYHGRQVTTIFKDPDEPLAAENELHYEPTERWGTICRLPFGPLAYRETPVGGEVPSRSTLDVEVVSAGEPDSWDEVSSLVHSDDSAEGGDHYMVETDEYGQSLLRFGNDTNGRRLPNGAEVHCIYQVGYGPDSNIGADMLTHFDASASLWIISCWNPFDVTSGKAPEPVAEIVRRAPEAYRYRQLRAVTLQDYEDRAEELPEVSRAAARYAWTGSWRTVRIAIDPTGSTTLTPELRKSIAEHLNAVRLIGEDLEIRPPRFVPLDVQASICIHPDYWIEDIRFLLEQEFSEGYTPDGRRGFFHPDRWTFGQKLRASEIIGRIQRIKGVDHVVSVSMKRWNEVSPGTDEIAEVRINEIIQVRNDPDHMEDGFMTFNIGGGRQ